MKGCINFVKRDFESIHKILEGSIGRTIPKWIVVTYYVIVGLMALPLTLCVLIWSIWRINKIMKIMEKEWER
jgi:hypothetical protein